MREYLSLIQEVLDKGTKKKDRTGTGTISLFGTQRRYNLDGEFPIVTTKKIHWKSVVHELLWFISGNTNIRYLVKNGVRIWNEWPYESFKKSTDFKGESLKEFAKKIKESEDFALKHGNLGPVYGKQWRNFNGIDQLQQVIDTIKTNPNSRRIILSSWNPVEVGSMALPPCHTLIQFFVNGKDLSCQLYQRSADVFLGVPFNISSYALLTYLVAQVTGLKPKEFIHTTGDTHIYSNHLKQVREQLEREPKKLPTIKLNPKIKNIEDFTFDDIELIGYDPHPLIRGKVAV